MGAKSDPTAVVDPELRVKGIKELRVVYKCSNNNDGRESFRHDTRKGHKLYIDTKKESYKALGFKRLSESPHSTQTHHRHSPNKKQMLGVSDLPIEKIYLDYNATTPLEPEVLSSIHGALSEAWGNPSSSHHAGQKAKLIIAEARENVARMIGAQASDIVFTSGGTEANNMILQTCVEYFHKTFTKNDLPANDGRGDNSSIRPHIISSHMEHPAVNVMLQHLENTGKADITYVPLSKRTGCLEVEDVLRAVQPNTIMVTVMLANNETGIIQPVSSICAAIRSLERRPAETQRILVHTDTAQAIGKISVNVDKLGVDYLTVVGHKFYGPRIGALYARNVECQAVPLYPLLFGGGQERDYRPGTENTGMIAGLGKACELVADNLEMYKTMMGECRDYLEELLQAAFPGRVQFNGKFTDSKRLPNTSNVSILGAGLEGYKVLSRCKRLQASVGAACHSQNRPSPILLVIGVPEPIAKNAVRLSVGRHTSKQDIDIVVADIKQAVEDIEKN